MHDKSCKKNFWLGQVHTGKCLQGRSLTGLAGLIHARRNSEVCNLSEVNGEVIKVHLI